MEPVAPIVPASPTTREFRSLHAFLGAIRTRIVAGLILALPIAITFWIVLQLYLTLQRLVIAPVIWMIRQVVGPERLEGLPVWWNEIVAPLVAIGSVLALLYFLGLFVSSRVVRAVDWVLSRVPLVTTIYQSVRGIFQSLGSAKGADRFKRVVSVPYPHPGLRVPGFVTRAIVDVETGRTILSVFVPFAPLPTSGFVLLVPEEDVVDLGWSVNETMQGIVSGGLSMPPTVRFSAPTAGVDRLSGAGSAAGR